MGRLSPARRWQLPLTSALSQAPAAWPRAALRPRAELLTPHSCSHQGHPRSADGVSRGRWGPVYPTGGLASPPLSKVIQLRGTLSRAPARLPLPRQHLPRDKSVLSGLSVLTCKMGATAPARGPQFRGPQPRAFHHSGWGLRTGLWVFRPLCPQIQGLLGLRRAPPLRGLSWAWPAASCQPVGSAIHGARPHVLWLPGQLPHPCSRDV